MSRFSDVLAKILGKIKGLVPGANTISSDNFTGELDKPAGVRDLNGELPWLNF